MFARLLLHPPEIIERADEFLKGTGVEVAKSQVLRDVVAPYVKR
jgi:hypothetical protein